MRKILFPVVACTTMFVACDKSEISSADESTHNVSVSFSTKNLTDVTTKSSASDAENAISQVAIFGVDANGNIQKYYGIITNTATATNLTVSTETSMLYAVANVDADLSSVKSLDELKALVFAADVMPQSPFAMAAESKINGSADVTMNLVRSIAKIEVVGNNDFVVEAIEVKNTPTMGYIMAQDQVAVPAEASTTDYTEVVGEVVYVAESTSANPVELLVKGQYSGKSTAYTVGIKMDGVTIDVERNTNYLVTLTPNSDTDCDVNVSIPEWGDTTTDQTYLPNFGDYMSVDFHQHTGFTDGKHPIRFVLNQSQKYMVDVIINSEHGGAFAGNASDGDTETTCPTWINSGLLSSDILGDVNGSGENQKMWRWQILRDYSFPKIMEFNGDQTNTSIAIQGLEWNPPGHEHCSVGVITGQFDAENPNANAMAEFEYKFDNSDTDTTGGAAQGWVKSTKSGHEKSMEAAAWLQANHRYTSWMVPAHPERKNLWQIDAYRDLNDVAPDVFVAFESIPGHQASATRGGIGNSSSYGATYTFGGVGVQAAQIGGLWDAMISEGRRFWLVANSDYHSHVSINGGDFYPGEYQKTYVSMADHTAQSFANGLRSGNIYCVHGDLISRLEFSVGSATMGQTYSTDAGKTVTVRILVEDPETNNNNVYTALTNPVLDHIDLIAGSIREKVSSDEAEYTVGTYDDVKVIARFDAVGNVVDGNGIVSSKWSDLGDGLKLVEYKVAVEEDTYFRLRGTNNALNVAGETDENGNPLVDTPAASNTLGAQAAFEDLWFYSNPIFVRTK